MLLAASPNPKYNPLVLEVQRKLNAIKNRTHANWPLLVSDGKFGEQTKRAVIQFQIYKNITPVSGKVGDTTFRYINEEYNYCPMLRANTDKAVVTANNSNNIISKISDFAKDTMFGILKSIDDAAKDQLKEINKFSNFQRMTPELQKLLHKHLRGNSTLKSLQNTILNFLEEKGRKISLTQQAKGNTNAYNYARGQYTLNKLGQISAAQSQLSKSNMVLSQMEKSAKMLFDRCIMEVRKFNIQSRIEQLGHGGYNVTKNGSLKGGGVLLAINLIPIISDFIIWAYSKLVLKSEAIEEWNKLVKDIISFIEGVLIGAVITAIVSAIGLSGGVAVVVIVVVCLIIGLLIALFCPEGNLTEWMIKTINEKIITPVSL